ncbi:hypothetical protein [Shewanella colwelliana]|uniref:hypothetical protein n=1 Tax=Shewanella colwelliana TaxID=23 RepID=UPI0022AE5846|nr:hypothetical protein [Shewanella colwelliana]MCZ4336699.1 hypothetical protein [Shewanella colwelliana]
MNLSSILNSKYLLRFLTVLLSVLFLFSVIVSAFVSYFKDDKQTKLTLFEGNKDGFSALALGTSHSIGFHFPSLGVDGINFHDGGGDIEEALFKADILVEQARYVDIVFLAVSPGSLHMSQRYISDDWGRRRLAVINNLPVAFNAFIFNPKASFKRLLFKFFPIFEFRQIIRTWLIGESSQLSADVSVSCFGKGIVELDYQSFLLGDYKEEIISPHCLAEYADSTIKKHIQYIEATILADSNVPQLNVKRLVKLASMLKDRYGRLVLVVPPLTREYYEDARIQKWVPQHNALLAELAEQTNIEVYDFHDFFYEQMADGSNDFFYDDDHLALPGAIEFSKALKKAMDDRAISREQSKLISN